MKLSSTLLAAPLLAVAQAQGQGDYNSICPSQADGKPHEINPGYFVEFKCETLGPNSGAPVGGITSAKDCAKTCQNAVGCNGSSWVSSLNLCYLDKGSSGSESAHSKTVYMKHVAQQCASCNKELADVKKQLAECKAQVAKPAGGSNYCKSRALNHSYTGRGVVGLCSRFATSTANPGFIGQGRQGGPNVPPFVIDAEGKKYRVWCNLSKHVK